MSILDESAPRAVTKVPQLYALLYGRVCNIFALEMHQWFTFSLTIFIIIIIILIVRVSVFMSERARVVEFQLKTFIMCV